MHMTVSMFALKAGLIAGLAAAAPLMCMAADGGATEAEAMVKKGAAFLKTNGSVVKPAEIVDTFKLR